MSEYNPTIGYVLDLYNGQCKTGGSAARLSIAAAAAAPQIVLETPTRMRRSNLRDRRAHAVSPRTPAAVCAVVLSACLAQLLIKPDELLRGSVLELDQGCTASVKDDAFALRFFLCSPFYINWSSLSVSFTEDARMAELGVIGSIIQLAGTGAKLGMVLYTIADGVGSAGREARFIAAEVSMFSQLLIALSKSLERPVSEATRFHEVAETLIGTCRVVLEQLSELCNELSPTCFPKRRRSKMAALNARFRWILQRPKVAFIRDSISSFKTSLVLLIASMDYSEALDHKAPKQIRTPLKSQVELLVATAKDMNNDISQYQSNIEELSPDHPESIRQIDCAVEDSIPADSGVEVSLIESGEMVNLMSETSTHTAPPISDEERRWDLSLAKFNDMLFARQLVLSLATDVIARHEPIVRWSWNTFEPPKHRVAPLSPESRNRFIKPAGHTTTITGISPDHLSDDLSSAQAAESSPLDQDNRLDKETPADHSARVYMDLATPSNEEHVLEKSPDHFQKPERFEPVSTERIPSSHLESEPGNRSSWEEEMADLKEAVAVARIAVQRTPLHRHSQRAVRLNNLGVKLGDKYLRTREVSDLDDAITATREAIQAAPLDHSDRATWLNNLRLALRVRYTRTGELADLKEATTIDREEFQDKSAEQFDRAGWLDSVSGSVKHIESHGVDAAHDRIEKLERWVLSLLDSGSSPDLDALNQKSGLPRRAASHRDTESTSNWKFPISPSAENRTREQENIVNQETALKRLQRASRIPFTDTIDPPNSYARNNAPASKRDGHHEEYMQYLLQKLLEDNKTAKPTAQANEEREGQSKEDITKAPIKFKDCVGRKFTFPFPICKKWDVMESLIKQTFLPVDVIGEHVGQGHYDLTGPGGRIILPQIWESTIQPGWEITMHLWPMPEDGVNLDMPPDGKASNAAQPSSSGKNNHPRKNLSGMKSSDAADITTIEDKRNSGKTSKAADTSHSVETPNPRIKRKIRPRKK